MDETVGLDKLAAEFSVALADFPGLTRRSFTVAELLADPKWDWGYDHGVYCFVTGTDVMYVGRALGATLGQRLWSQLHAKEDRAWAQVVEGPATRVEVFVVDESHVFMASALEAFLIDRLGLPPFNNKKQ